MSEVSRILAEAGIFIGDRRFNLAFNLTHASINPSYGVRAGLSEDFPQVAAIVRRDYVWRDGAWVRKES